MSCGALQSMNNLGLNFRKFPVTNATALSGIFEKQENLARYTTILGNFVPGISVPFDFPPGISGIFSWMVCFSKWNLFPRNISELVVPVSKLYEFLVEWKAPMVHCYFSYANQFCVVSVLQIKVISTWNVLQQDWFWNRNIKRALFSLTSREFHSNKSSKRKVPHVDICSK